MKTFKKILFLIIALILLQACSPAKRLERFHKNHPFLFEAKIDTITIHDTINVTIPGIKIDTSSPLAWLFRPQGISINKESEHIHLKGDTITKKIYIQAHRDTIFKTIYKEKKVPVTKYIVKKIPFNWHSLLKWPWMLLIFLIAGFFLWAIIKE